MTLREFRKAQGLSLEQLGDLLGKSRGSISAYELGKTNIPDDVCLKIKEKYGVDLREEKTEERAGEKSKEKLKEPMTGEKLKELRLAYGLSQTALARIVGKAPTSITGYEKGTAKVPKDVADKFEEWIQSSTTTSTTAPSTASTTAPAITTASSTASRTVDEEAGKKKEAKASDPDVYIQSQMGGTITVEEVIDRVKAAVPSVDAIYIKPEENRAYWTAGKNNGSTVLW